MYLQNVYSSRFPDQQAVAVALMTAGHLLAGKGMCRVHGGGFAGTIQAFVPTEDAEEFRKALLAVFEVPDAESAGYPVEGIGLERHLEGIGLQEFYTVMDAFVGGFTHEGLHHSGRYIYAGDPASGLHGLCYGNGAVTGAACHVQDLLLGAVHNFLEGLFPPDIVNTQGHKVVKAVVGRRDVIEHLLYFLFLWHN
jgi:hypothetical protein